DIVTGETSVSAEHPPLQLVAEYSGRIRVNDIKSQDSISAGQLLAWIDNPADPRRILQVNSLLNDISLPVADAHTLYNSLPKDLNLGDLTVPYSSFHSTLRELADYQEHRLFDKQEKSLADVLQEQRNALNALHEKEQLSLSNLGISDKFMERYTTLLEKKVISQAEFDQAMSSR